MGVGVAVVVMGLASALLPWLVVANKRERRLKALELQLPEAADLISRSLRAGPGEVTTSAFQGVVLFDKAHYREWALTGGLPTVPRDTASFDFDVRRIKAPLITTTLACGWTWVPVTRRAHLTAGRPLA